MFYIRVLSVFMFIVITCSIAASQNIHEDTLAVREICDSNGMQGVELKYLIEIENDRVVSLKIGMEPFFQECISIIPSAIEKLTALRSLILIKHSDLKSLPSYIGRLQALDSLIIQECGLTELPEEIGGCSSLAYINLHCPVRKLPSTIGNLSSLKTLICDCDLDSLPSEIGNLTVLEKLDICSNKLNSLPESIGNLSSLKSLNVCWNFFSEIPEEIVNLSSLTFLDFTYNQLTECLPEIGNLKELSYLSLKANNLTVLPDAICNLLKLQSLHLLENDLISLPDSIGKLSFLIKLDISSNKLNTLPESISSISLPQGPSGINLCFNPDLVFTEDQQVWAGAVNYAEYEEKYCDTEIEENFSKSVKSNPGLLVFSRNLVKFTVQNPGHVLLEVFNVKGEKLKTLFNGYTNAGDYTALWRAEQTGIYLIKLTIGESVVVKKSIIVR